MKQKGKYEYSIWIIPKKRTARTAAQTILDLSKTNGTVAFDPHITLLGYISGEKGDVIKKARSLSSKLRKIPIRFGTISHSGRYTMPLFVKVKANRELFTARRYAEKEFVHKKSDFAPHMSLMYANLSKGRRLKILSNIKDNYFGEGFDADTIRLYARRWEGKAWNKVASFKIS